MTLEKANDIHIEVVDRKKLIIRMKTVFIVLIVIVSVLVGLAILWLIYRRYIGVEVSAEIEIVEDGDGNNNYIDDLEAGS